MRQQTPPATLTLSTNPPFCGAQAAGYVDSWGSLRPPLALSTVDDRPQIYPAPLADQKIKKEPERANAPAPFP